MTSSQKQERLLSNLSSSKVGSPRFRVLDSSTPDSRNGRSPLSDESIWRRLREAGFDEESIKRRDKAALISYIAKLEAEVFDYQHHMGLLILEKKDWASKYEQVKATADSAERKYKLDQAAHLSALAEARKREESLKKALAIEKECVTNIEKALHEMRAESAETKIAAENKMVEACNMLENAQKKLAEAEAKKYAVESLEAEANRYHRIAERKLKEVEEREDELRRSLMSFKFDCDAKEKQISLERQSLCERQKTVQQGQEKLLEGQALLNQREEYISGRHQELSRLDKELETSKAKIEEELKSLNEEKTDLNLNLAALSTREEAISKREALLDKKERELLCVQEKLASKEYDEIQRLMAKNAAALEIKKIELETEMEHKRTLMANDMETKRRDCELREVDLHQREELVKEREQELEIQLRAFVEKEKDLRDRANSIQEKEENFCAAEEARELQKIYMQKEKEEIKKMKINLQESVDSLENKRKEIEKAQEELEASNHERNELLVLEMKLKDEIESIRAQKLDLVTEADELKAEKSKFETEWELIDEKREELQKEAERISEERKAVSRFLKDERDSLKLEKDALQEQFKRDVESLSREREAFTSKMEQEQSEWFSKIQQERTNFVQDIELQKIELENSNHKRRDEIESYLKEKEEAFEHEKAKELRHINSLKEMLSKERENVELELKKLESERVETALDRERREEELVELKKSVEELEIQREKLKEQRELLHEDREKISTQIQHLNQLESSVLASENIVLSEIREADFKFTRKAIPTKRGLDMQTISNGGELELFTSKEAPSGWPRPTLLSKQGQNSSSPTSPAPLSWIKRCALVFKPSSEKSSINNRERSLTTEFEGAKLLEDKFLQSDKKVVLGQPKNVQDKSDMVEQQIFRRGDRSDKIFGRIEPVKSVIEEPKVILEVPIVDERVKTASRLDAETKPDVTENSLYTEQGLLAGRKRVNSSYSLDNHDTPLKERRDQKKRRQGGDTPEIPFGETPSNCALSKQKISDEDEDGLTLFNQTPRSSEQNGDFVDEHQKILGDATENKDTETSTEPNKLVSPQNILVASEQDIPEGKGSDG